MSPQLKWHAYPVVEIMTMLCSFVAERTFTNESPSIFESQRILPVSIDPHVFGKGRFLDQAKFCCEHQEVALGFFEEFS